MYMMCGWVGLLLIAKLPWWSRPVILLLSPWLSITFSQLILPMVITCCADGKKNKVRYKLLFHRNLFASSKNYYCWFDRDQMLNISKVSCIVIAISTALRQHLEISNLLPAYILIYATRFYNFSARIGTFSEKDRIGKLDEFYYQSCQNYCPLKPELLEFASSTSTFARTLASITTAAKTFKP